MCASERGADLKKAKQTVDRLLKIRLRSEKELRDKLKQKSFSKTVIDQTIIFYKELQYIDDRLFAQSWISSRLKKPFGLNRIQFELKLKGIDKSIIESEIEKCSSDYAELDVIQELAERRMAKYGDIDKYKLKQRLYGYLSRRGFSSHLIKKVVYEL